MFKEGAVVFLVFVINNEICNSGNFLLGVTFIFLIDNLDLGGFANL